MQGHRGAPSVRRPRAEKIETAQRLLEAEVARLQSPVCQADVRHLQ
jgi:hypothetical protein